MTLTERKISEIITRHLFYAHSSNYSIVNCQSFIYVFIEHLKRATNNTSPITRNIRIHNIDYSLLC